jgi:hypothetical protein
MERLLPRPAGVPGIAIRIAVLLALTVSGCVAGSGGSPNASIIPGSSIAPGTSLDPGDLRLALVDRFGPHWYCDPDQYPIVRASFDEGATAVQRFSDMQVEGVVFGAVVRRLGLQGTTSFSDAQKLDIYRLWKGLVSISLDPAGNGAYRFDYVARPATNVQFGVETTGTIDATGTIAVQATASAGAPNCPICLARGTPIDTPTGSIAVDRLALGDRVWTLDRSGRRVPGTVIALGSTLAPASHRVLDLVLADGRTVTASAGHPLADGRPIGSLRIGDLVAGSRVVGLTSLAYGGGETFDLVVSGSTGTYLSDGIPLGSTLR